MEQLKLQTRNFDKAKKQLKTFSETIPQSIVLDTVSSRGGLFNWFKHSVTGDELNSLTAQIQKHLIALNSMHVNSIKEFGQVYEALDALDKDYIQAILLSIEASKKVSKQAKETAQRAIENSQKIDKSMKVQEKIVAVLTEFKAQVDQYKQLENIDELWSDSQTFKKELQTIKHQFDHVNALIEKQAQAIAILHQFKDEVEQYEHLQHIDELWSDSQAFKKELETIEHQFEHVNAAIEKQAEAITILHQFKEQVEQYEHLQHIDELWSDSQAFKKELETIEHQLEHVNAAIEKQAEAITMLHQFKEQVEQYEHLQHIDELWSDSQAFKKELKTIEYQFEHVSELIDKQAQAITMLHQFKEQVEQYEHLQHIDELWSDSQTFKSDIKAIYLEVKDQKERVNIELQEEINSIRDLLHQIQVDHKNQNELLSKKLNISYIVAGSAMVLALLNLGMTVLGNM